MRVSYDEVLRFLKFKEQINKLELKDIEWVKDGEVIQYDKKLAEFWEQTGLSNLTFVTDFLTEVVVGKEKELLKELCCYDN